MKVYEGKDVRNIAVAGHGDCGKTSLVAAYLYTTGATTRLTSVDEGNTVTDHDEEEIARKVTISSSLACIEWKNRKLNFIDTPGYNIFINETKASMLAADAALILVDGVGGIEVQTEKVWGFAADYGQPRVVFINKLDRERADFSRVLAEVQEILGRSAVPVQLPIGSEKVFRGVIDLIGMKAYTYERGGSGKGKAGDIPSELAASAESAREALIEMVAESDDDLLNEFLEELTLPPEKILAGLQKGVAEGKIFPVLCGSATQNMGADAALDFLAEYIPPPTARASSSLS